jgi:RNA polymerase sigma-70 factor (ECF subfamily)
MASDAADRLLAEHAPALRNFLGARCRDAELAAELMQEVAARLVTAAARLKRNNGNQRAYVYRVAVNVWHDYLRRQLVRRRAGPLVTASARCAAPAADEHVLERELREAVSRAVAALPQAQREVVRLRHEHGLKFREIAERLDRPVGTVLTQMRAALAKIRAALEGYR